MDKITVKVGDKEIEIETKPITLICKDKHMIEDVKMPNDIYVIDAEKTLNHSRNISILQSKTIDFVSIVFRNEKGKEQFDRKKLMDDTHNYLALQGIGFQHVVGMIDLMLTNLYAGKRFSLKYPESYLHPAFQANLADMIIAFQKFTTTLPDIGSDLNV